VGEDAGILDGKLMTLRDLLRKNRDSIVAQWQNYALSIYASDASGFFNKESDRFANPVGFSLKTGTEAIFDSLVDGLDAEKICGHLESIVKARAIQDFTPSESIAFIFSLKSSIRKELGGSLADPGVAGEMTEIEAQIDQVALFAFDIYCRCREKVSELRINEVKRNVAAIMKRIGVESEPMTSNEGESVGGGSQ
jgi:hypothetical protein